MVKKICYGIFIIFCFLLNILIDAHIGDYFDILTECFGPRIVLNNKLNTSICFIIAFISLLLSIDILLILFQKNEQNKGINYKHDDGTYGTANWMTKNEIKNVLGLNDEPGLILGKYKKDIVKLPFKSFLNKNIAVFGSSRKHENDWIFTYKYARIIKV